MNKSMRPPPAGSKEECCPTKISWRILVVEDEPAHVAAISRVLTESPQAVEIQVAQSLQEYRSLIADNPPDLALVDLNLPDGTAMEVLAFPPEAAPFPILVMTSFGSEQIAVDAIKAGALDYVVKSTESIADLPHILNRARRQWHLLQERKWAQEALRENELRLQFALDAAEAGVWIYNIKSGEIYWDERMQAIFGLEPGNFAGTLEAWLARVHPEDQPLALMSILQSLEKEQPFDFEYRVLGPNREWRDVKVQALLIKDEDGQAIRLAGICRDITERRRAAAEKQKLEAQLFQAQKLEAIGTLAGGIAHDFNNILAAIMGNTEMASYSLHDSEDVKNYLEEVLAASIRAKNLINQILTFARKLQSEKKPLALPLLIVEAVQSLGAHLPKNIEMKQNLLSHRRTLADPDQIRQIILNLLKNAAQALADTGGTLEVALVDEQLNEPIPTILGELQPGSYVKLEIRDTGPGIDPAILPRIFEPYFSTRGVGQGSGLGLAAVLGLTKMNGGEITVHSEPGLGTTFSLYFPSSPEPKPSTADSFSRDFPRGLGRILIVDDEPAVAELWSTALSRLGYATTTTTNSLEAQHILTSHPEQFDLLITDLLMPDLNGLDLSRQIRAIRPDFPIIAVTGYSDRFSREEMLSLGIDAFLPKPLEVRQLVEAVKQIIKPNAGTSDTFTEK
jgi:PAS domain S-box-containing protein